jgi:hypothetical protein
MIQFLEAMTFALLLSSNPLDFILVPAHSYGFEDNNSAKVIASRN